MLPQSNRVLIKPKDGGCRFLQESVPVYRTMTLYNQEHNNVPSSGLPISIPNSIEAGKTVHRL